MTGQLIQNGIEAFTPATSRITEIAGEILPYILYIAIACLGITIVIGAVKYIIEYASLKSMKTFRHRENRYRKYKSEYVNGTRKNGVFHAQFRTRYIRKRPKRYQF